MLESEFGKASKTLQVKTPVPPNIWETLLSRQFSVSTADYKPVIFDAPDPNKWFTGRQKELESLETCLALDPLLPPFHLISTETLRFS